MGAAAAGVPAQVRGAYVKLERARAAELGYESPIWDNIQGTHTNFDRCLDALLDEVGGRGAVRECSDGGRRWPLLAVQPPSKRHYSGMGGSMPVAHRCVRALPVLTICALFCPVPYGYLMRSCLLRCRGGVRT